jgi:acyl-CoA synthetase (AMP-forming)/AMP-acid ligase II
VHELLRSDHHQRSHRFAFACGTICAAPNFTYAVIARRVTPEQLADLDLTSWHIALNGAEPVRRRTIERITETLAPAGFAPSAMRSTYGMAEVTLMATISSGTQRYLDADADALEENRYTPDHDPFTQRQKLALPDGKEAELPHRASGPVIPFAGMPFGLDCRGRVAQYDAAFPGLGHWRRRHSRGRTGPVLCRHRGNRHLGTTADAASLWSITDG